ncbi:MAG: hypothetical protein KatS3mg102_1800 [Planctomycetota bacterium]|nr:MAG: hypothetical protein KatS3mg102_1800 [Planctomycetota bacterium]
MRVHLQVVAGPYAGERFVVELGSGGRLLIGREPGCEVAFPASPTVSNRHAWLVEQHGVPVLIDNSSTNGLWVDGQRVTRWPVRDGGVVGFGRSGPQVQFFVERAQVPLEAATSCGLCGQPLGPDAFVCFACRQRLCAHHYDPRAGVCRSCASRRVAPGAVAEAGAYGGAAACAPPAPCRPGAAPVPDPGSDTQQVGTACGQCGAREAEFFFSCARCARFLCARHYEARSGLCEHCGATSV